MCICQYVYLFMPKIALEKIYEKVGYVWGGELGGQGGRDVFH